MTLQYIYNRLLPFKLDINDRHAVSSDIGCVSSDVITDAGFELEDMDKLPRNVFLGKEMVSNGSRIDHEIFTFSRSGLREALKTDVTAVIKNGVTKKEGRDV